MEKLSLNDMLQSLYQKLEEKRGQVATESFFYGKKSFIIFLSATDGQQRAIVVNEKANTFAESWEKAIT